MKTVEKIRQIVKLKQVVKRWKSMSRSGLDTDDSPFSDSDSSRTRIPSGCLAVYVGAERRRFLIPTRFLKLPIFLALLKRAEEEFGFQASGGLVLPCEVGFFEMLLRALHKDEHGFKGLVPDEVLDRFSEVGLEPCKEGSASSHVVTPLLQKARV